MNMEIDGKEFKGEPIFDEEERERLLQRLVAMSINPEGLDWATLKNIDKLGWGCDDEPKERG